MFLSNPHSSCMIRFEDNILCLLSNAVKFSQEIHDIDVEIKITGSRHNDAAGIFRAMLTIQVQA